MYLNYFNLKRKPFSINTDPDFLWLGPCHARVLDSLNLALDRGGVLLLTGDVGTGKTTLVNKIVQGLPSSTHTVRISDPCLELHLIFSTIAKNMGFDFPIEKKFESSLVKFLTKLSSLNEKCLVIVDEVQRIGARFVKALYSWQELGNGNFPITVLLVGQNEFEEMLPLFGKGEFLEKTILKQKLVSLTREETAEYVRFRMLHSGAENEIFSEAALDRIAILSKGYPRMINILCDHCLFLAHRKEVGVVDDLVADIAAKKMFLSRKPDSIPSVQNKAEKILTPAHKSRVTASLFSLGFVFSMFFFIAIVFRHYDSKRELLPVPESSFRISGKIVENLTTVDDVTVDSGSTRSIKNLVDEVFKGVEHRMLQLPQKPENIAGSTSMEETFTLSKPPDKPLEKRDPGSDSSDPGDVITWLLERDESRN